MNGGRGTDDEGEMELPEVVTDYLTAVRMQFGEGSGIEFSPEAAVEFSLEYERQHAESEGMPEASEEEIEESRAIY